MLRLFVIKLTCTLLVTIGLFMGSTTAKIHPKGWVLSFKYYFTYCSGVPYSVNDPQVIKSRKINSVRQFALVRSLNNNNDTTLFKTDENGNAIVKIPKKGNYIIYLSYFNNNQKRDNFFSVADFNITNQLKKIDTIKRSYYINCPSNIPSISK